jgi:hypothetical protein
MIGENDYDTFVSPDARAGERAQVAESWLGNRDSPEWHRPCGRYHRPGQTQRCASDVTEHRRSHDRKQRAMVIEKKRENEDKTSRFDRTKGDWGLINYNPPSLQWSYSIHIETLSNPP